MFLEVSVLRDTLYAVTMPLALNVRARALQIFRVRKDGANLFDLLVVLLFYHLESVYRWFRFTITLPKRKPATKVKDLVSVKLKWIAETVAIT